MIESMYCPTRSAAASASRSPRWRAAFRCCRPTVRTSCMKHQSGERALADVIAAGAGSSRDGAHKGAREYSGGVSRVRPAGDHRRCYAGISARSTALDEFRRTALRNAALFRLWQQENPHRGRGRASADRPCRDYPVPCMRLPHSPAAPGRAAGYEFMHVLCGRRGDAARLASLPPAASRQAKMPALRASDDHSPE